MAAKSSKQGKGESSVAKWAFAILPPLIVAAVIAGWAWLRSEDAAPELDRVETRVATRTTALDIVDEEGLPAQQEFELPEVTLFLHNTGDSRAALTRAQVVIEDHFPVAICEAGGGIDVTGEYGVELPGDPAPNTTIEVPIEQQLGPDEVDRFTLTFRAPFLDNVTDGVGTGQPAQTHVYALHLLLAIGEDETFDAGRVVVSTPYQLDALDLSFHLEDDEDLTAAGDALVPPCYAANRVGLRELLARDGDRAPELDELGRRLGVA